MATVTLAHYGLIQGNRRYTIYGLIATIVLAILFTGFQGFEYVNAPFTIADSVYGSTFYFTTGFHGLMMPPILNFYSFRNKGRSVISINWKYFSSFLGKEKQNNLTLYNKNKEVFILDKNFLEWLSGFTDSEGNFSITLRNKRIIPNIINKDSSKTSTLTKQDSQEVFSSAMLTFQIGLHIDDLKVLETIKHKLQCGNISISKVNNRCNYSVNDRFSLLNIILPVFDYAPLKSSKYSQYQAFKEAVNLFHNKIHLTPKGKDIIIDCKNRLNKDYSIPEPIIITDAWLLGFIEGDGSFSTSRSVPRLKFENHIKEFKLIEKIRDYLGTGSLITKVRGSKGFNNNPTVILEINKISILKNKVLTKYGNQESGLLTFYTKKSQDFEDWSVIVNLYYLGYHLLPEGKSLIFKLKSNMNNFRLTSNTKYNPEVINLNEEISSVFAMPAPYEIKNGVRLLSGTDKWVSESLSIVVIDKSGNKLFFDSLCKCSEALSISRTKIKNCIISGNPYKDYIFSINYI